MRYSLKPHPTTPCDAVTRIDADVARRDPATLSLTYTLTGNIAHLRLPPRAAPSRTDELWRHTCLEAFVRGAGEGYAEFNFSPSTEWAAYRFTSYRSGMAQLEIAAPRIDVQVTGALTLHASLDAKALGDLTNAQMALTAVIEETSGRISYWSLSHPSGKPDFHHADNFALALREISAS